MTELATAPISTAALERARLRRGVRLYVQRPLLATSVVGQVWLTFGAHAFAAWAFGASSSWDDGQWWSAWVGIAVLDVVLFATWHAIHSGRIPPRDVDAVAHSLAWAIALGGFLVSLLSNFGNRILTVAGATPPAWLAENRGVLGGLFMCIPFSLVLAGVTLIGRTNRWLDELDRADDVETADAQREAQGQARESADQLAAAQLAADERQRERDHETELARIARTTPPPPATEPASAEPARKPKATAAAAAKPAPAAAAPAGSAAARVDAIVLGMWKASRTISPTEADRQAATAGYGSKRIPRLEAGLDAIREARAEGREPTADEVDTAIGARFSKPGTGTGQRLLDAFPPDETGGPLLIPVRVSTENPTENPAETPGENRPEPAGENRGENAA